MSTKLTDLQRRILGKMKLTPMSGIAIKYAVGHIGTDRAFANALLRMRDKGLVDCAGEVGAITYVTTPAGLSAFLDAQATRRVGCAPARKGEDES